MNINIREADLESDRESIINILLENLTPHSDDLRFNWLYKNNPWGEANVWLATDAESQAIVGAAAAFPRRMYVGDEERIGWILGDFCIQDQYRSLGPALQLQRACIAEVEAGKADILYDFPSASMMAIYKRLRIDRFGQLFRLSRPLRVDRKVEGIIHLPFVARGISRMANFTLSIFSPRVKPKKGVTLSLHQGKCGEEFSVLSRQIRGKYGICVQRSAEYLNWRYLAHPYRHHHLLTARFHGDLRGYVIFTHTNGEATLVDLFGIDDPSVLCHLVDGAILFLKKEGVMTVSAPLFEFHPWMALLQKMGFRVREVKPVLIYASPSNPVKQTMYGREKWLLMNGDRES